MIKIGILGDIGSGKSFVARNFGFPVLMLIMRLQNYINKTKIFLIKLKKKLPKFIHSFPIEKLEISNAILANNKNLSIIVKIVHLEIRKKMYDFLNKNKNKKLSF
jgi:dephospho-CoA kinase